MGNFIEHHLSVFHLRPTRIPHRTPTTIQASFNAIPFFYHFHPVSWDYVNDDSLVSTIDEILVNGMNRVIHTNLVECNSIRRKDNNYPFGSSEIVESFTKLGTCSFSRVSFYKCVTIERIYFNSKLKGAKNIE